MIVALTLSRIEVYFNGNVASKGQNTYAFDGNAKLASYCELASVKNEL